MSGYSYPSPGILPNGSTPPPHPHDGPPIPPLVRVLPVSDSFEITPEPFVTAYFKRLPVPPDQRAEKTESMKGVEEDRKKRLLLVVKLPGQFWAQGKVDLEEVRKRVGSLSRIITASRRRVTLSPDEQGTQRALLRGSNWKERLLLVVKLPGEFFAHGELDMGAIEARLETVQP